MTRTAEQGLGADSAYDGLSGRGGSRAAGEGGRQDLTSRPLSPWEAPSTDAVYERLVDWARRHPRWYSADRVLARSFAELDEILSEIAAPEADEPSSTANGPGAA